MAKLAHRCWPYPGEPCAACEAGAEVEQSPFEKALEFLGTFAVLGMFLMAVAALFLLGQ